MTKEYQLGRIISDCHNKDIKKYLDSFSKNNALIRLDGKIIIFEFKPETKEEYIRINESIEMPILNNFKFIKIYENAKKFNMKNITFKYKSSLNLNENDIEVLDSLLDSGSIDGFKEKLDEGEVSINCIRFKFDSNCPSLVINQSGKIDAKHKELINYKDKFNKLAKYVFENEINI